MRQRHARLDLAAHRPDRLIERDARQLLAHRALGDLADRVLGGGKLEQIEFGVAHRPAHRIGEIDDVLIAGQHQVLAAARGHVEALDLIDVDAGDDVDRRGQRQPDAGFERAGIGAEARDNAALLRIDAVDARRRQPQRQEGGEGIAPDRTARRTPWPKPPPGSLPPKRSRPRRINSSIEG